MTQTEIRKERLKFEMWAAKNGYGAGRNEAGYYDDDKDAGAAWIAWRDRAFEGRNWK